MMARPRLTDRPPIAYTPWSTRRSRALAAGMCVRCGEPATRPGVSAHCAGCLALLDEARLERMDGNRAHGLCACGGVPRPGARTCAACYQPRAVVRAAEQEAIDRVAVGAGDPTTPGLTGQPAHDADALRRPGGA